MREKGKSENSLLPLDHLPHVFISLVYEHMKSTHTKLDSAVFYLNDGSNPYFSTTVWLT